MAHPYLLEDATCSFLTCLHTACFLRFRCDIVVLWGQDTIFSMVTKDGIRDYLALYDNPVAAEMEVSGTLTLQLCNSSHAVGVTYVQLCCGCVACLAAHAMVVLWQECQSTALPCGILFSCFCVQMRKFAVTAAPLPHWRP